MNPPRSECCLPAPPVMHFDSEGNLLQAWGGPGQGYDWPANEHGSFVKEFSLAPDTKGNGSVWGLDFSQDRGQTYLYTADGENNHIWLLLRDSGAVLSKFSRSGRYAGQLHWIHNMAVDSKGNIYTTGVDNAKRAQKFVYQGLFPPGE